MQLLKTIFNDTLHLLYPHVCCGCGNDILEDDNQLCLRCTSKLPHTGFAQHANNPIEKIFWGRIPVVAAHSEFFFTKDSLIQHLIHQLKYKGNMEIGFQLGRMIGRSIQNSNRFDSINIIIPLPLYPDKERSRGYNQAAIISKGISDVTNIPVVEHNIIRQRFTETQTRKHRTERWENVEGSFLVKDTKILEGKNILLVDDVITTGASLEACANVILKTGNVFLSIATLAVATK